MLEKSGTCLQKTQFVENRLLVLYQHFNIGLTSTNTQSSSKIEIKISFTLYFSFVYFFCPLLCFVTKNLLSLYFCFLMLFSPSEHFFFFLPFLLTGRTHLDTYSKIKIFCVAMTVCNSDF
jgi:hypothetical protein